MALTPGAGRPHGAEPRGHCGWPCGQQQRGPTGGSTVGAADGHTAPGEPPAWASKPSPARMALRAILKKLQVCCTILTGNHKDFHLKRVWGERPVSTAKR